MRVLSLYGDKSCISIMYSEAFKVPIPYVEQKNHNNIDKFKLQ